MTDARRAAEAWLAVDPDPATREDAFRQIQQIAAEEVPLIPSWIGPNVAVSGPGMSGVEETLDAAFIFRFWNVTKEG